MRFGRYRTALIVGVAGTGLIIGTPAVARPRAAIASTPPTALDGRGQPIAVGAVPGQGFAYTRLRNGVQVRVNGVSKTILFYGPSTVRVNTNLGRNYWTAKSIVVVAPPTDIDFTVADSAGTLTVASARLRVVIDKATGAASFFDPGGKLYTSEDRSTPQTVKSIVGANDPSYEVENRFRLAPDEAIYGFGFTDDARINRRGTDLDLVQTNIGIIIPVMVSNRRYGVMWDTYSHMRFVDDASGARLWAEDAPGGVDYYFMGADTMDGVVQAYRKLTGDAPMYPKQAFGLFMSKERYTTQARLVEVAETFRRERFPLDYIVQDWQYWGGNDGTWSGMTWDKTRFPDPEGTIRRIHDMNLKLMVSIWPSVGDDTALGKELDQHGLRFAPLHWISKKARIYDAFSPLGRRIYFKHAKSGLLDEGVDALWMDGTEVEVSTAMHDAKAAVDDIKSLGRNAMGDFSRYLNAYTLMTTLGTYEGQRATSDKRALTLTRSAWAGAQRTGATSWSGDTQASWETLRHQVAGGVNVTVTGNPYWTQDTGGFFVNYGGGERNPHYRELFARWFQYATFNPLMRVHGTNIEREPYIFKTIDPQVYASLLGAVNLRYRLLPYIYGLGWQVTSAGYTMMRPLAMDFPDDTRVHVIDDTFMFGGSLLVHPVTRAMYHVEPEPAATVPVAALSTPDGKPGLAGQYFEGRDFDKPAGRVIDTVIDKRWPQPPLQPMPPGLGSLNDFSARWDGFLTAPEDGEFELGLQGDDGVRLFVDGRKLIDDWTSGASRYRSAKVMLRKGQRVAVRIEFYQGDGDRDLRFTWRRPDELRAAAAKASESPKLGVQTYLPTGGDWYDFWTNERMAGGRDVSRDVPLDVMPLYVRAGAILPMGPTQQYATEKPGAPYEIRIYPGANGRFTVYEDDNETYAYERGERATYDLTWDDARRTLTIGARSGRFPGMIPTRTLNIVVVKPGAAGGIADLPVTRSVSYIGKPMQLTF